MGQRHVPHYADTFFARRIDNMIKEIAAKLSTEGTNLLLFLKRFLDDIFEIFVGSAKTLHIFLEEINKIHTNIKFTMTHTTNIFEPEATRCSCPPQD